MLSYLEIKGDGRWGEEKHEDIKYNSRSPTLKETREIFNKRFLKAENDKNKKQLKNTGFANKMDTVA